MEIDKVVNENGECFHDHNNTQQQQLQKKQVRRRLHSNKPYQERLMNMAEARKEIATALKFHRASMKQQQAAATNHHLQPPPPPEQVMSDSAIATTANYSGTYPGVYNWPISTFVPPPPPPPPPPPSMNLENLNLVLPNQTLGLNLNFQDFNNLNTKIYHTPMMPSSSASSSSMSTSSSAAKELAAERATREGGGLHYAVESDEFEEIIEINSHEEDDVDHPFEKVMEFPQWLINANEPSCFQDLYDHHLSHQYSPDPSLPCMDIGEIEGMDAEWLA